MENMRPSLKDLKIFLKKREWDNALRAELVDVEEAEADQATVRFSLKVRILRPFVKGLESLNKITDNNTR